MLDRFPWTGGKSLVATPVGAQQFIPAGSENLPISFAPATDGVIDCAPPLNAIIAELSAAGGGYLIIPNLGLPYMLGAPLVPRTGVKIVGWGMPALRLMANANCAVVETLNFQSLIGGAAGGIYNWEISGIILDGNAAQQSASANPDFQTGISAYWYGVGRIADMLIMNIYGNGMYTGGGNQPSPTPANYLLPTVENVQVVKTGRHGWWNKGPHDMVASNVLLQTTSQNQDGGFYGFWNQASGRYFSVHAWTENYSYNQPGGVVNFPAYALRSDQAGQFIACYFESAKQSVYANHPKNKFVGCYFSNPAWTYVANTALVDLYQPAEFSACDWDCTLRWTGQGGNMWAINWANSAGVSGAKITGTFENFDALGEFNFAHDAGLTYIEATGSSNNPTQGAGTAIVGVPAASSAIRYTRAGTGGANAYGVRYVPSWRDPSGRKVSGTVGWVAFGTSTTPVQATIDGQTATRFNTLALLGPGMIQADCVFVMRDVSGNWAEFRASDVMLTRSGAVDTTAIAGGTVTLTSPTKSGGTVTGWRISIAADTTLGGFNIQATGPAAHCQTMGQMSFMRVSTPS